MTKTKLLFHVHVFTLTVAAFLVPSYLEASTPRPFTTPRFQSAVSLDSDSVQTISGADFEEGVEAAYLAFTGAPPASPTPISMPATGWSGSLDVYEADLPHSIIVKAPPVLRGDTTYALYFKNPTASGWSAPVVVNAPQVGWLTPAMTHATQAWHGLTRGIKLVGRDLVPGSVRLQGQSTSTTYIVSVTPTALLDRTVAEGTLPSVMVVDTYEIEASFDGVTWSPVDGEFEVTPDPQAKVSYSIASYGAACGSSSACAPNDGLDDTCCMKLALMDAMNTSGGGIVSVPAGTWNLNDWAASGCHAHIGLAVAPHVDLVGSGTGSTTVVRGTAWTAPGLFTLFGSNRIEGVTFHDAFYDAPVSGTDPPTRAIRFGAVSDGLLGSPSCPTSLAGQTSISDISVHDTAFYGFFNGIEDNGMRALQRIVVTDSQFVTQGRGIFLGYEVTVATSAATFSFQDSVISDNLFQPGHPTGTVLSDNVRATQIGAARRLDMSNNVADGQVHDGWRAAYFFHKAGAHETVLVSQNTATCTSERGGDGEFIIWDDAGDVALLPGGERVLSSSASSVEVEAKALIDTPAQLGHWIVVVAGTGRSQMRRLVDIATTASQTYVLNVAPDWDVVPEPGVSIVQGDRMVWRVVAVGNTVDNSEATCGPRGGQNRGGTIGFYGDATDSIITHNTQHYADGFRLGAWYYDKSTLAYSMSALMNLEIRGNDVLHGYIASNSQGGGVWGSFAIVSHECTLGTSHLDFFEPTVANMITLDDNLFDDVYRLGGAIAIQATGYAEQCGRAWVGLTAANNAIFGTGSSTYSNSVYMLDGSTPQPYDARIYGTGLYNNYDEAGASVPWAPTAGAAANHTHEF